MLEVKNVFLSIFLAQNQNKTLQKGEQGYQNLTVLKRSIITSNRSYLRAGYLLLLIAGFFKGYKYCLTCFYI